MAHDLALVNQLLGGNPERGDANLLQVSLS